MKYEIAQVNRLGNRHNNQDRFHAVVDHDVVLLALGDGMGGRAYGEVAAEILMATAERLFLEERKPIRDPERLFERIFDQAHNTILTFGQDQTPPVMPGTTGVLCLVQENRAVWAHVGDSRLYLFQNGLLSFRTIDHSYVEELRRAGHLSREELENHPKRNQITQCLGCRFDEPTMTMGTPVELHPGDVLLLCSDGLWGPLDDMQMAAMSQGDVLEDAFQKMAEQAETVSYPLSDNVSVIGLRLLERSAPAPQQSAKGERKVETPKEDPAEALDSAIAQIEAVMKEYEKEIGH